MKNAIKYWGIIALVAIMGFSMTACGDNPGGNWQDNGVLKLGSADWSNETGSAQQYGSSASIKLSDFTAFRPQQDDVLRFKMSGESSTKLKLFHIEIFQFTNDNDWDTYTWLGASPTVNLPNPFNDYIIEATIWNVPDPNRTIYVQLINVLWHKDSDDVYTEDSGDRFPPNTPDGTVMATISNFSISLVVDRDPDGPGGGEKGAIDDVPVAKWTH